MQIILIILLLAVSYGKAQVTPNTSYVVWDNKLPFPLEENMPYPNGVSDIMVQRAGSDNFYFLHDAAIVEHKNVLYAAWYNCPTDEMQEMSLIRGRRSNDGGLTWSEIEIIASDRENKGIMYVPVTFLSYKGILYAFVSNMEGGPDLVTKCEIFKLNEKNNSWESSGFIAGPFLPNCPPIKMGNSNFIMAGRMAGKSGQKPTIPAVAISRGEKITEKWDVIPLNYSGKLPSGENPDFPETTVLADGQNLTAFVRNHSKYPILFLSNDYGQTWSDPKVHNFPFASSKIFAGTLSTGQNYVLANLVSDGYRNLLTISTTRPGEKQFSKVWKIRYGYSGLLAAGPEWSYPCAIEYNNKLYIVYTSEKHHCCLTIIPVESLKSDN
ncbi:MAG TPA: exo-alpha-sialidase [Prolixibacteraceae bacterium]|nr:exo-alpha-sialidase [Prolixibacteraceae bacterium]